LTLDPDVTLAVVRGVVWPPAPRQASAVAASGERIVAVGTDEEVLAMVPPGARVIDARGATVMPALNDAHVHFMMGSRSLADLDLAGADTQAAVERRIRDFVATHPEREWVVGRGWFYSAFPGGMPGIEALDRLVPDRPAYLESYDAHTAWVNSRALAIAGLKVTDAGGTPAGILKESAMQGVRSHLPQPTAEMDREAVRSGMRLAASHGIASVQEAGHGLKQVELYQALLERGELTMRIRLAFDMEPGLDAAEWERRLELYQEAAHAVPSNEWIGTGILKAFADGVVESGTAALLEPYADMSPADPGAFGTPFWERGELANAVRAADARGWQIQVHAIGDAAIRDALDAFEACHASLRHRIEHIEAPAAADVGRFAALGVIASMQPQHAEPTHNLLGAWQPKLGAARASGGWPWASILRSGGRLAFGSDWPVVPIDPFGSLHVAVNRQTRSGEPPGGWVGSERLDLADAVAAWTSGSAYAERSEPAKGRLGKGMLADIAILDRDLMAMPMSELADVNVVATAVGGRVVFEASVAD
jgi:predicted amidohydrolase YtcJ